MKHFQKIVGEKVYLSPIHPDDYETFTKRMNDSRITDWTGATSGLITLTSEKKRIEEMTNSSKHDIYTFSIIKKEDDTLIGNISLVNIYSTHRRAMLAVMIGDVNEQGKGYGTDAITCLLDYAFNQLNLNTIELHVHNFNEKAKKCYEKCWFKTIGTRRQDYFNNGKYYDTTYMDITREDFDKNAL